MNALPERPPRRGFLYPYDPFYPCSDGQPMGESTTQVEWILALLAGFEGLFANRADVFVAGDLFWYPVEGDNKLRTAPDILVAFGRPKGDRSSYLQWKEGDIPPQVVVEVLSPSDRPAVMAKKLAFYQRYGVQEYVLFDPHKNDTLSGYLRQGKELTPVRPMNGWLSPRLGVRFGVAGKILTVTRPDGGWFLTFPEIVAATAAQQRADKLAAKLRELGVDPDAV